MIEKVAACIVLTDTTTRDQIGVVFDLVEARPGGDAEDSLLRLLKRADRMAALRTKLVHAHWALSQLRRLRCIG
jgi:hypothetical protein